MNTTTRTYVLLRAFVDELARCGMRSACTSPGSRCAPLVLSLARDPRISCRSHIDERCAGFFALGLAKASGLPVAVTCTSGTAAAELLPAAIEAHEARVPLLLLTADRPAELRANGAGQAIDQLKLFGDAAKWFFEVELATANANEASAGAVGPTMLRWIRTLACRAYWTALEGRPGAVHLNFPLREPLVGDQALPEDDSARDGDEPFVRRVPAGAGGPGPGGGPGSAADAAARTAIEELARRVRATPRGVLVAGRHERGGALVAAAARFCELAGWPLLADPLSGARRGAAAVAHYDALLRQERFAGEHEPQLVIRVGDLPVSKPLRSWLECASGAPQVAIDLEGAWQDPASVLSESLALEPASALGALADALIEPHPALGEPPGASAGGRRADSDWLQSWRSADELAGEALLGVLAGSAISEPLLAAELGVLLPEQATLFVASSMPVREIETFWPVRADPPRVLCNRGANGIDGTVSSAFGAAAAGGPTLLLIGDVALAHDIGGLLAASRLQLKLTIVLVDNGGGGIFDFLPIAKASIASEDEGEHEIYLQHIATPTGLEFERAAALYGLAYERAQTVPELRAALERAIESTASSTIVHVRSDRAANVQLHARAWEAVGRALSPPAAAAAPGA